MSIDRIAVAKTYIQTRMAHRYLRSRTDIARHQARLWRKLAQALAKTPALSALAGKPLSAFPIIEPVDVRSRLEAWNSLGLDAAEITAGADAAERSDAGVVRSGVHAGYSTGSSGTRGVFLSSRTERALYLGQSLAKLLPDPPMRRRRIGLCLRADNALYRDVANAGPFEFRFFGLSMPAHERARGIETFAPDLFVGPSHVLAELAAMATTGKFRPPRFERLFYGAEPMGALERDWITGVLGARPDPIYQATEGFLGAACRHGTLHLNEDSIAFEFEPAGADRFRPIVTDLRRTSQPIVRVRLDDLIQLRDATCPCGSSMQAIEPVEGRVSDTWHWRAARIFPRQVENAVSEVLSAPQDWRAVASSAGVRIACNAARVDDACAALAKMLADAGVTTQITAHPLPALTSPKRRRVQWADG